MTDRKIATARYFVRTHQCAPVCFSHSPGKEKGEYNCVGFSVSSM